MSKKPILCLDFDGVIHSYSSGWKGADIIPDPPVSGAIDFLFEALKHFRVEIYSSRSHQCGGIEAMQQWLNKSCGQAGWDGAWTEQIFWPLEKPAAMVTLDDRAITFNGTWPKVEDLLAFKPWNKRTQTKSPADDVKFTLDDFQKVMQELCDRFKSDLIATMEKGAAAKLDPQLLMIIAANEMEKLQT